MNKIISNVREHVLLENKTSSISYTSSRSDHRGSNSSFFNSLTLNEPDLDEQSDPMAGLYFIRIE